MNQALLIRADASEQMGTGHIMRCIALAQAWCDLGGTVTFVTACANESLLERLSDEGFQVIVMDTAYPDPSDWEITSEALGKSSYAWVVQDGYHFDARYQKYAKDAGYRLLVIDDHAQSDHYYADIVLNQNIFADERMYAGREPHSRLLLGTRYALLRREFRQWRGWQREVTEVARKVLITLGGSESVNVSLKVIGALLQLAERKIEAVIALGSNDTHYEKIRLSLVDAAVPIRLRRNADNMAELMAWADVAVSGGGSTCWELAFMGLPAHIIVLAENQRLVAEGLAEARAANNLGWHDAVSEAEIASALSWLLASREQRVAMMQRATGLVDGEGSLRVAAQMREETRLHLRPVTYEDLELLFAWANDPLSRQMSLQQEPIEWERHREWFGEATSSPETMLLIAELEERDSTQPIGQVRIDPGGMVSISIAPEHRRQGFAAPAIEAAIDRYRTRFGRSEFTAYIKPDNIPSQKVFERAGFRFVDETTVNERACFRYLHWVDTGGQGNS